jgi:hypothetical protein
MNDYYQYDIFNISIKFSPAWGAFIHYPDIDETYNGIHLNYLEPRRIKQEVRRNVYESVCRVVERHIGDAEDHIFRHKHIITSKQLDIAWESL